MLLVPPLHALGGANSSGAPSCKTGYFGIFLIFCYFRFFFKNWLFKKNRQNGDNIICLRLVKVFTEPSPSP